MLSAERRLCGQCFNGPSGVCDQSLERMSPPTSPLPAKKLDGAHRFASSARGGCHPALIDFDVTWFPSSPLLEPPSAIGSSSLNNGASRTRETAT